MKDLLGVMVTSALSFGNCYDKFEAAGDRFVFNTVNISATCSVSCAGVGIPSITQRPVHSIAVVHAKPPRLKCSKLLLDPTTGMPSPAGYRTALRLFQLAERFGLPVITLVDTCGAWPSFEVRSF